MNLLPVNGGCTIDGPTLIPRTPDHLIKMCFFPVLFPVKLSLSFYFIFMLPRIFGARIKIDKKWQ